MVQQISLFIETFPSLSILVVFIVSLYHGYRGYVIQRVTVQTQKNDLQKGNGWSWTQTEIVIVRYLYDAFFYFFCSLIGFMALWVAIKVIGAQSLSIQNYSGGGSALLVFLIIVAILGISGQLPQLIQQGKLPK